MFSFTIGKTVPAFLKCTNRLESVSPTNNLQHTGMSFSIYRYHDDDVHLFVLIFVEPLAGGTVHDG